MRLKQLISCCYYLFVVNLLANFWGSSLRIGPIAGFCVGMITVEACPMN